MPYVVTTRTPDERTGPSGEPSHVEFVSRRAVATLKDRNALIDAIGASGLPPWVEVLDELQGLPESGGTVGPLPDGTAIEVKFACTAELRRAAEVPFEAWMTTSEAIDAFNAKQAS